MASCRTRESRRTTTPRQIPALTELRPEWLFPTPITKANGEPGCTGPRIMTVKEPETGDVLCTAINRAKVTTIYPPASEIFFAAVRFLTGPAPQYWPMQLAGLLMSLTTTVLLLRALVARGRDPRWAALWGWCPLVATEGITNSHIDILGAMFVFIATLLVSTRRPVLGGIALGIAISSKLIPVVGSFALLKRNPFKVILGSIAIFALLYVPYILASGIDVLGYLPGYLSEEGYTSGTRFIMISLVAPGAAALVVAAILILITAALTWWKSNPDDPWLAQTVMIGVTLLIVTPRYPWYALMLVPMIAMTGRWEWLAVPLALTERLLIPSVDLARLTVTLAIVLIVVMTLHRAGPGALSRLGKQLRHPFGGPKSPELRGSHPAIYNGKVTEQTDSNLIWHRGPNTHQHQEHPQTKQRIEPMRTFSKVTMGLATASLLVVGLAACSATPADTEETTAPAARGRSRPAAAGIHPRTRRCRHRSCSRPGLR